MGDIVYGDWGGSWPNKGQGRRSEWRESKRRGTKPKKKRAKRGVRKERDEAATVSPFSSPLVKISSFQCGGVTDSHNNRDGGVARRDSDAEAVGGDSHAWGVRGGSVGARCRGRY